MSQFSLLTKPLPIKCRLLQKCSKLKKNSVCRVTLLSRQDNCDTAAAKLYSINRLHAANKQIQRTKWFDCILFPIVYYKVIMHFFAFSKSKQIICLLEGWVRQITNGFFFLKQSSLFLVPNL